MAFGFAVFPSYCAVARSARESTLAMATLVMSPLAGPELLSLLRARLAARQQVVHGVR